MLTAHGLLTLFGLGFSALLGAVPAFSLGWWARGMRERADEVMRGRR